MIDMDMTRRGALEIVLAGGGAAMAGSTASVASPPAAGGDWQFLVGRWHVRHRKLRERLTGSNDWMKFDGSCENWPMLGGGASVSARPRPRRPQRRRKSAMCWHTRFPIASHGRMRTTRAARR